MAHAISKSNGLFSAIEASVAKAIRGFGGFWISVFEAQAQARKFETLSNLTDKELADKYGINRDQLVAHIFGAKYNL